MNVPFTLGGMKVIVSSILPYTRPVKSLPTKQWHGNKGTGRYALRVNAKWRKRYGTEEVNCMLLGHEHVVMVSQSMYNKLMEAMRGP